MRFKHNWGYRKENEDSKEGKATFYFTLGGKSSWYINGGTIKGTLTRHFPTSYVPSISMRIEGVVMIKALLWDSSLVPSKSR